MQQEMYQVKNQYPKEKLDEVKGFVSGQALKAVDLATQKVSLLFCQLLEIWILLSLKQEWVSRHCEMCTTETILLCWSCYDMQTGQIYHTMPWWTAGFGGRTACNTCSDVQIEPVLQDITGEELNRGANTAPAARLGIVAGGFWERQRSDIEKGHANIH